MVTLSNLQSAINILDRRIQLLAFRETERFNRLTVTLKRLEFKLVQPSQLHLIITGEENMALKFKLTLPVEPAQPHDIVKGTLKVSVAGVALPDVDTAVGDTESVNDAYIGQQNDAVHAEFHYEDDAGNLSGVDVLDATLTDNIVPPTPGDLGLVVTEEV